MEHDLCMIPKDVSATMCDVKMTLVSEKTIED